MINPRDQGDAGSTRIPAKDAGGLDQAGATTMQRLVAVLETYSCQGKLSNFLDGALRSQKSTDALV
jgi:hypothetical protein